MPLRQDKRGRRPMLGHGNREWFAPKFMTFEIETEQAKRTKIKINPLAIGDTSRGGRIAVGMAFIYGGGSDGMLPAHHAIGAPKAQHLEFAGFISREENRVSPDNRGRMAGRQRGFPNHVGFW